MQVSAQYILGKTNQKHLSLALQSCQDCLGLVDKAVRRVKITL